MPQVPDDVHEELLYARDVQEVVRSLLMMPMVPMGGFVGRNDKLGPFNLHRYCQSCQKDHNR